MEQQDIAAWVPCAEARHWRRRYRIAMLMNISWPVMWLADAIWKGWK